VRLGELALFRHLVTEVDLKKCGFWLLRNGTVLNDITLGFSAPLSSSFFHFFLFF